MADERHDEQLAQVHRLVVRFGNELLQDGFTSVPNLVLTHYAILGVTAAEMMFSIHIWQYWWTEKDPYPALQTIADRMSVTRRQVRNYAQSLKTKGYLVVNERSDQVLGQLTSEYDFGPLLDAVLFVRSLLSKLTPLATRAQQQLLPRALGQVFSHAGATEVTAALDALIADLRPHAPLLAQALQEERAAIAALKAPRAHARAQSHTTPGKSPSSPPRKNRSEGGRKNPSEAPRKAISSEEYIEKPDEDPKHTHREEDEDTTSTGFELFASTQQPREPAGLSKAVRSRAALRQGQEGRAAGMTAIGQILARGRGKGERPTSEQAPHSPKEAQEAAAVAQDGSEVEVRRRGPSTRHFGAHGVELLSPQPVGGGESSARTGRGRRPPPPKLPPFLTDQVTRYSEELHDGEHLAQNLGQAGRLWKASGWSDTAFSQALTEARAITLKRDIKKRAVVGGEFGARNKMPYYFKVLRDLLGLKDRDEPSRGEEG